MQCSVFIATSLDGFIAREDGGIDWLSQVEMPGEDYGYSRFAASVDALIMGRNTYDTALGFEGWPYEGKRVIVLTNRTFVPRHGEEQRSGTDLHALVEDLANAGVTRAYIDGGNVIRQFLAAGLVDDLTISIVPIILGSGKPLFGELGAELTLHLESSQSWQSGLAQLRYRAKRSTL
jgi:dihydrofolate reductase